MKRPAVFLTTLMSVVGVLTALPAGASTPAPSVKPWLLAVSDMPVGWTASTPSAAPAGCFALRQAILGQHPGSHALVSFEASENIPYIDELVASWPTSAAARHAWDAVTALANGCHQYTSTAGGTAAKLTVAPLKLGHYGDASSSYQVEGTESGITFAADYLVALKGRAVVSLDYGDIGAPALKNVQSTAKLAVAKIKG